MSEVCDRQKVASVASVSYAEEIVECPLEQAWKTALDYQAWNPSFVGATVSLVSGTRQTEGELVLIKGPASPDAPEGASEFYARTVKLVPHKHIVWFVYPKEGNGFRNFVDFEFAKIAEGIRFSVSYYAQEQLAGESLRKQLEEREVVLRDLAAAFKAYCESVS